MKKRSLKTLQLNKKSISKLKSIDVAVKGGEFLPSSYDFLLCEAACFTGYNNQTEPTCV